ncbi:MAG: 50S ribosomal protein L10 [Ignavibacteriales bacterium]|jgi:large subunit ribosomal protein L10|nr:50S ribosomal protein L10 [Ignavibacteriales bacterium]
MNKVEKGEVIEQIKELINNSSAMFLVDYRGVNVADINKLRSNFRKDGVTYKVLKNTLFKKALEQIGGYEKFNDLLEGMIGVAFAGENFVAPAKIIKKYNDESQKLTFKGCYLNGVFYGAEQLETLASMPTKEEIIAGIIGSVAAPASGIVGAINAVMRDLVTLVDEISKKKAA